MEINDFYKNLGKRIKRLRENAHLTQEKLAEKAGISLDFLGKIEVNIKNPSLRTIVKLSNILNIEISEFFKDL